MYKFHLGIDISKLTLDGVLLTDGKKETAIHSKVSNTPEGIEELFKKYSTVPEFSLDNCLICVEATGVYTHPILNYVSLKGAKLWMESGTRIKRSMGIQRGKNDKIDALRIATYAFKNQEDARIWRPTNDTLDQVKHLNALRDRLVDTKKRLVTPVEEFHQVGELKFYKLLQKAMKASVEAIEDDIAKIDKQIKTLIDKDSSLKELYALITSVVGVGVQTAINLLIYTDGFTLFDDARKLACYAGVAPFEHSSGSSIRGKTRVSKLANMKLKSVLQMAALSAVRYDHQLKDYYEKNVAKGKAKLSVLNAVKNKLIHRIMSVVQRKKKYENSENFSLFLS